MVEKSFNLLHALEPKRDAYGFALRPQHIQRYREYLHIYKEEEEERSEKWENFLEQHANPVQPCLSEEDKKTLPTEATESKEKAESEKVHKEGPQVKATELKEENASEENQQVAFQSKVTEFKEDAASEEEYKKSLQDESTKSKEESSSELEQRVTVQAEVTESEEKAASEEECKEALEAETTNSKEEAVLVEESKQTIQAEVTELNEEAISEIIIKEGDASSENFVSSASAECETEKEVQLSEETKTNKVQKWAETRPTLFPIENMMSLRVTKRKSMKDDKVNESGDHLPLIKEAESSSGESEDEYEEKICVNEISDNTNNASREQSNAVDGESQKPFFPLKEELENLVHGGVPKDLRGEVWQAFVGVKARRVERYYEDLLAQETNEGESDEHNNSAGVTKKWRRQIEKDIPRTFPGHPALNDDGRDSLRRLLIAYARHNPCVGYCQAMNFFAGLLLLLMPEENAFWTLVGLIDDYFDGYYTEEMIESQVDQLVFEELMRERFPKLVNHLDYLGVQVAWISGPWFLSIFINMLPWESVLRVWDVLLFEGNRVMLFRTALALMDLYGPALVTTKDAGDAITLLQSLAGSTFDSSQLVFTACMGFLAVTEGRLQVLREKHRPAVLEVVEERSKRGRVWKDSKGLASKLYSFKHDTGPLVEKKEASGGLGDEDASKVEPRSSNLDELLGGLNSEADSLPDLQEQVVWLKVELCRLLEEKRSAILRAEELETALMEMVKQDNRRELSARIEQLEQEVADLRQALADKKEQEAAMLKVLMRIEQEQRIAEEARRNAEQDAAAQRYAANLLQEKYDKAMASIAQMEKRVVMAESMLEATLHYESGQAKAVSSPRSRNQDPALDSPRKRTGLLSFGLGWRDRNKGKLNGEGTSDGKYNPSNLQMETINQEKDEYSDT